MFKIFQKTKQKTYNFLRWSEKWTKTDMVYLAQGGFWLTLGQVISAFAGFLLSIAFANLMAKDAFGVYKYVLSIVSLLSISTLNGMNTAVVQSVARGYDGSFLPAIKTKIKWGFIGSLLSIILSAYYFVNENYTLTISFLIVSIFVPFMESLYLYTAFLNGKKNFKSITRYNVISKLLSSFIIFVFLFFSNNLLLLLLIYFSTYTSLRLIFTYLTIKKYPFTKKTDTTVTDYGKKLSLIGIINSISNQVDSILVFHFLGSMNLAIYSFAIIMPEQIRSQLKNVSSLALPKFSEGNDKIIKENLFKKIYIFTLFLVPVISIYIIFSPLIFKLLFPQYLNSIIFSQLYSISLLATPTLLLGGTYLNAQKKEKELFLYNTISSFLLIIFVFLGVYYFQIIGVIIAKIIHKIINFLILSILIKKAN